MDFPLIPGWQAEPRSRAWNLWSWVEARDVGQACRLALEAEVEGADAFTIAAADTLMTRDNASLLAAFFPGVKLAAGTGPHETLLSIAKARRVLGYSPRHSWRR